MRTYPGLQGLTHLAETRAAAKTAAESNSSCFSTVLRLLEGLCDRSRTSPLAVAKGSGCVPSSRDSAVLVLANGCIGLARLEVP